MYRLGLQLALKGGREALVRLLLTAVAVAVGVTILLGVFADYHAFQVTSHRPSWESTTGAALTSTPATASNALLWNYSENIYKGQFIEQLDVAALGSNSPVLPGITKLPGPGQFYASPALAVLLKTVPKNELGDRFPGHQIGTIGQQALSFPTELAIYIGRSPSQMIQLPGTVEVTNIVTQAQLQGPTDIYTLKIAFGIGALAILFPLLILINTATRLSAARREERYAAMRLIGATPRQINIIASVDAIVGSLLGAILGSLMFLAARPAIADISFSGVKFFPDYVTPTPWAYIGMIVGVPIIAAAASLISLRRVQVSPLGVSRKVTPPKPRAWRVVPLVVGVPFFINATTKIASDTQNANQSPLPLLVSFLLVMVGIVLSGPWLTMQVAKLLARFARSASSLLAARHLSDNPKAAFRTASGLVLAVFIGSVVSVLLSAINEAQNPPGETSLNAVLRVPYSNGRGLAPQTSANLISKLQSYAGTIVVPIYYNPAFLTFQQENTAIVGAGPNARGTHTNRGNDLQPPDNGLVSCASLRQLSVLGACAPGVTAVTISQNGILSDNPLLIYKSLPLVTAHSPSVSADTSHLQLAALLVKASSPSTLEQIRTYLAVYNSTLVQVGPDDGKNGSALSAWQMGKFEPETVGEVAAIRNNDATNVNRVVLAVIALTLVTAGCSLAVTVGGSLIERKRPFTLLRVSGVSLRTLYATILLEAVLPLILVSAIAIAVGLGVAPPIVRALLRDLVPQGASIPTHPTAGYYIALGAGLMVALGLIVTTLPLLKRITEPEDAKFE